MSTSETVSEETRQLRRTMRDLVALSMLPAAWTGHGTEGIAKSLAEVLLNTLSLDLIYIRLQGDVEGVVRPDSGKGVHEEEIVEVAQSRHQTDISTDVIAEALASLEAESAGLTASIPNPFGSGSLRLAITRFGFTGDCGMMVAGSERSDFPTEAERLLLGVAANQTAVVIQRKRAEELLRESERRFAALAELVPQLVWTAIPDGAVDYLNLRWYGYTGQTPAQALGHGWADVLHPEDRESTWQSWQDALRAGKPVAVEHRLRAADSHYEWFLVRGEPLRDEQGRIVKWFGTCTGIDELKRLEQALKEADRRKDEFLSMLAHELRNPLAAIVNAGQVLDRVGSRNPQQDKLSLIILRQSQNLTRMVDDLLDVSRITRGKIRLSKEIVDLSTIIGRAVESARPLVESRQHELVVSLGSQPMRLEADATRLEQILVNLLNNAAKYTDPGGRIRLSAERENGEIVVRVRDNGIGIPPEMLRRVFDLFTQVDTSLDRSKGGLGIGLAMVRNLAQLHGGIVTVHSEGTGHGSEFVVRLPALVQDEPEPPAPPTAATDSAGPRVRVLIVDDSVDTAECILMLVEALGHVARMVHTGAAALEAVRRDRPDLMFIDIGMPEMNGYELAQRLRAEPDLTGVQLIALTGYGRDEDRRCAENAGFDGHLVKPVSLDTIEAVLTNTKSKGESLRGKPPGLDSGPIHRVPVAGTADGIQNGLFTGDGLPKQQ